MVHHRDALDAEVAEEVRHHRLGLVVVGGAQIDHVVALPGCFAQKGGTGERRDIGHASRCRHRRRGARRGRAHRADQREHALVVNELPGVGDGLLRLVAIIERAQFQTPPGDAAARVRLVKRRLNAKAHVGSKLLRRAGESRRLAEQDAFVGNAGDRGRGLGNSKGAGQHRHGKSRAERVAVAVAHG